MIVTSGKDIPMILNLLKGDKTYEDSATVTYVIYSSDGSTVAVSSQSTAYSTLLKGYLDTLDVSVDWSSQAEGNFVLLWTISDADDFPSTITEELVVLPGGEVETGLSLTQALRIILAVLAGKASGGGTTEIIYRDTNDSKDRVTATVDRKGNRTTVTTDSS